jgi:hypothetical protein
LRLDFEKDPIHPSPLGPSILTLVQELNNRFNETSSQLLICSVSFNPRNSFQDFNVENLMTLAKLYADNFNSGELRDLGHQLCLYIGDVRTDARFSNLNTIGDLYQKWWR